MSFLISVHLFLPTESKHALSMQHSDFLREDIRTESLPYVVADAIRALRYKYSLQFFIDNTLIYSFCVPSAFSFLMLTDLGDSINN
jgi:hypothetical protein